MNITLYQCAADVQAALDHHFDTETERQDTLEAVIGQFEVKAKSVIGYIKNQEATETMLDEHIKQMTEKLKTIKARNQRFPPNLCANVSRLFLIKPQSKKQSKAVKKLQARRLKSV